MPSTDIDGSPIIIFSAQEARIIYYFIREYFKFAGRPEIAAANKIARNLKLPELYLPFYNEEIDDDVM